MIARLLALVTLVLFACTSPGRAGSLDFTVPCVDDAIDLHGDPAHPDLVLFVGGNQWMVMPDLIAAFQKAHPEVRGVFYETLPPGTLAEQIASDGLDVGGLHISVKPDVYMSGVRRMHQQFQLGTVGAPVTYAANTLAIMVTAANPKHVTSLSDLAKPGIRIAMPNPQYEGVARLIETAYRRAGGEELVTRVMTAKAKDGTTVFTRIHHRQTPMWLLEGKVDAGVTWLTEGLYQERIKSGLKAIPIPPEQNAIGKYVAAVITNAPHPAAAQAFVAFLTSENAQAIYRSYGFAPPSDKKE